MKRNYILECADDDGIVLGYLVLDLKSWKFDRISSLKEEATALDFNEIYRYKKRLYKHGFKYRLLIEEIGKEKENEYPEIPGYTLHGDYYLADKVIPYKNWKEARDLRGLVILPNGKTVIAHTLSKEELETIPLEERKISENGHYWYWTSTPSDDYSAWDVNSYGGFNSRYITGSVDCGGVRLGFKNPFLEEKKNSEEVKIPGYTLHGDYYLADKVITNTTWEQACKMAKMVILPNGKPVIAHTLSKEELETIPEEERRCIKWYWTSTPYGGNHAWGVCSDEDFVHDHITCSNSYGGIRLGFKNPFLKEEPKESKELTYSEINSAINEVMDLFDYERVHKVMEFLDWKWVGKGVPEIYDLRVESRRLLEKVANKVIEEGEGYYFSATGGFKAEAWKNDDGSLGLRLNFILEECEN